VSDVANSYQLMQRLGRALCESEAGEVFEADRSLLVWSAARRSEWDGERAPSMVWESGPYGWTFAFTGHGGQFLGDEEGNLLETDQATRDAYAAFLAAGYYLECETGYMLAAYRA